MASIKNDITTRFKTEGARKTQKETESIGKAQTRLGQASASAGRSFSAQANGLGGLVGVYAAAAANVFAISAAFAALNRAAQFETIIRGTEQLAAAVGSSATIVVEELKRVTQGQLSIIEAATSANLALSAGFNTDQIAQLGEVANKAAKALGRNLTDAFQRITRGAIKLEPELLDEIGIFTRINPALEAYAQELGKSVSQLTQFERRQAFVNQVIKDGQQAFQDVDISGKSTQATFEKLVANFTDLALVVGKFVADSLVPFAEFLDKNLGNRLILLGGIGTLVFSALGKAIGGTAVAAFTRLGDALNRTADGFALNKKAASEFAERAKSVGQGFVGGGLVRGERGAGAEIKRDLAGGTISTQRALEIREKIPELIKAEKAEQAKLKSITGLTGEELKKNNIARAKSVQRTRALLATQRLVTAQIDASGKASIGFAAGLRVAGKAAAFVATQIGKAFRLLQILLIAFTTLQTVLSFFDIDLFESLRTLITGINKESREAAEGMRILANSTNVVKTQFAGLAEEVQKVALAEFSNMADKSVSQLQGRLKFLKRSIEDLEQGRTISQIFGFKDAEETQKELDELNGKLKAINLILNNSEKDFKAAGSAIKKLSELTKIGGETIAKSFETGTLIERNGELIVSINNVETVIGTFNNSIARFSNEGLAKAGQRAAQAVDGFDKLNKTLLEGGAISAEKASKQLGVFKTVLEDAIKLATDAGKLDFAATLTDKLNQVNDTLSKTVGEFTTLNALNKQFSKEASSEFKFLDDRFLSGIASAETGKIAKNAEEQLKFRGENFKLLMKQLEAEEALGFIDEIPNQTKINELTELRTKFIKKAQADLIKQVPILEKQRKELEKSTRQFQNQLDLLEAQNDLLQKQVNREVELNKVRLGVEDQKNALKIQQSSLNLSKEQLETSKQIADAEIKRAKAAESLRAAQAQASISAQSNANTFADAASAQGMTEARRKVAEFERDNVLSQRAILDNQIALAKLERDEGLKRIEREKTLINKQIEEQKKINDAELKIVKLESAQNIADIDNRIKLLRLNELVTINQAKIRKSEEQLKLKEIQSNIQNIKDQKEVANLQAKQQKENRDAQLNLLLQQAKLQEAKIKSDLGILKGNEQLLKEQARLQGETFSGVSLDIGAGVGTQLKSITDNISAINNQFSLSESIFNEVVKKNELNATKGINAETQKENIIKKQIKTNNQIDKQQGTIFKEKISQLLAEKTLERDLLSVKLATIKIENEAEQKNLKAKIALLDLEAAGLEKLFIDTVKKGEADISYATKVNDALGSARDIVANELSTAFQKLNDALVEGTLNAKNFRDGFNDFVGGTLKKVQQDFFKQTIADPAADFLSDSLFEGLGLQKSRGIDSLKLTGRGNMPVEIMHGGSGEGVIKKITDDTDNIFTNLGEKLKEFGSSFMNVLSNIGSSIMDAFSGGGGGSVLDLATFGSGSGTMFGSDALGPESFLGLAGGGKVKKFAGGGINRDRVPALLEPGEFVMKRSAARSIGDANLNAMNATGQMGGNVSVNIVNQGTPQEATQQSAPKFDGEKFVIDIVTRDLRNNGPIRKSMRGAG